MTFEELVKDILSMHLVDHWTLKKTLKFAKQLYSMKNDREETNSLTHHKALSFYLYTSIYDTEENWSKSSCLYYNRILNFWINENEKYKH